MPISSFYFPRCYERLFSQDDYQRISNWNPRCSLVFDPSDPVRSAVSVRCINAVLMVVKRELVRPIRQTGLLEAKLCQSRDREPIEEKIVAKVNRVVLSLQLYSKAHPEAERNCGEVRAIVLWAVFGVLDCVFPELTFALMKWKMWTKAIDIDAATAELLAAPGSLGDGIVRETCRRMAADMRNGIDMQSLARVFEGDRETAKNPLMPEVDKMEWFESRRRNLVPTRLLERTGPLQRKSSSLSRRAWSLSVKAWR